MSNTLISCTLNCINLNIMLKVKIITLILATFADAPPLLLQIKYTYIGKQSFILSIRQVLNQRVGTW